MLCDAAILNIDDDDDDDDDSGVGVGDGSASGTAKEEIILGESEKAWSV